MVRSNLLLIPLLLLSWITSSLAIQATPENRFEKATENQVVQIRTILEEQPDFAKLHYIYVQKFNQKRDLYAPDEFYTFVRACEKQNSRFCLTFFFSGEEITQVLLIGSAHLPPETTSSDFGFRLCEDCPVRYAVGFGTDEDTVYKNVILTKKLAIF